MLSADFTDGSPEHCQLSRCLHFEGCSPRTLDSKICELLNKKVRERDGVYMLIP